jgi:Zn-finger nucleic acid-binding protein
MLNVPADRAMETRYDCPVCLGLPMEKLQLALSGRTFTLDGCQGCGGIWFDAGEMKLGVELGSSPILGEPDEILRFAPKPMACHGCGDLMGRNLDQCPSCGWQNVIDCPVCETAMDRRSVAHLVIDTCPTCDGTWLDRVELRSMAHLSQSPDFQGAPPDTAGFARAGSSHPSSGFVDGTQIAVEILAHGGPAAGQALVEASAGVVEASSSLVEVLAVGLEAAPEVAGAVLEAIGAILGGLLSGL